MKTDIGLVLQFSDYPIDIAFYLFLPLRRCASRFSFFSLNFFFFRLNSDIIKFGFCFDIIAFWVFLFTTLLRELVCYLIMGITFLYEHDFYFYLSPVIKYKFIYYTHSKLLDTASTQL